MGFNKEEDKSINLELSLSRTLDVLYKIDLHDLKLTDEEYKLFKEHIKQYEIALELEKQKTNNGQCEETGSSNPTNFSRGSYQVIQSTQDARQDEQQKIKKAIESEFDDPQHFCSCPKWCNCWEEFWGKQKAELTAMKKK